MYICPTKMTGLYICLYQAEPLKEVWETCGNLMVSEVHAYPWEPYNVDNVSNVFAESNGSPSYPNLLINSLRINVPDPADPTNVGDYIYGI